MKLSSKHPDLNDMIEALRTGDRRFARHLAECERCRSVWHLLDWSGAGAGRLEYETPDELIGDLQTIPRILRSRSPRKNMSGRMVLDSWRDRPAPAVREAPSGVERRVRFAASHFIVELVAKCLSSNWEFVARVYDGDSTTGEFILKVGHHELPAGRGDCYYWTSARPPRRISLSSPDLRIDLEGLKW